MFAESFADNINWTLLCSALVAIVTLLMWLDARKQRDTVIQPQPLAVKLTEELHKQFADRAEFEKHAANNTARHAQLFQQLDRVERESRAELDRRLAALNEERRATLEHLNEQFTYIRENIAEIKTELKIRNEVRGARPTTQTTMEA